MGPVAFLVRLWLWLFFFLSRVLLWVDENENEEYLNRS